MKSLELVKWFALVLMTGDHVNAALFARELPVLTELGRIVMPLFAFAIGINLARPGAWRTGRYGRMVVRLLAVGVVAAPLYVLAFGAQWLPLNIMFTFALAVGVCWSIDAGRPWVALALFLVGGLGVDYLWPGVALVVGVWAFARDEGQTWAAYVIVAALLGLCVVNGSLWALASVPIWWLLQRLPWTVPRSRWAFYAYYPAHLGVLALAVGV